MEHQVDNKQNENLNSSDNKDISFLSELCYIRATDRSPIRRAAPKIKRNDSCPIDSNKKFKKCCGAKGINHCAKLMLDYLQSIDRK